MIVAKAKRDGLIEVCIGEDDLMFPNQNGFEWFLKNKPKVYDIYGACNYIGKKPTGQKGAFRADTLVGFHLYMVHSRYYDTFLATKVSRGFTHEMVRHRAGFAYSQESTHYINYGPDTGLINVPETFNQFPELKEVFEAEAIKVFESYKLIYDKMRESGIDKKLACSTARQIMPTGIESKLVFTGNIRSLRHFINARANKYNVQEIRNVGLDVYDIMKDKAPNCFSDMERYKDDDGNDSIKALYKKV